MFSPLINELQERRARFIQACREDVLGVAGANAYAQEVYRIIQHHFSELDPSSTGWFLTAVGGLGRGEMSFVSDVDVMFIYAKHLPPALHNLVHSLVQAMWDGGFELGHSVSSVTGIKQLIKDDFSARTTCLETRCIFGDSSLYDRWRKKSLVHYSQRQRKHFLEMLNTAREKRSKQLAKSSYLLEPHIKEGLGGLRDLHALRWCGTVFEQDPEPRGLRDAGYIDETEYCWLEQARDFLWRVRLQLHLMSPRRQDQLVMQYQPGLAARLGFEENPSGGRAVEGFMRSYYRHTARVRRVTDFLMEKLRLDLTPSRQRARRQKILPGPFVLDGRHIRFYDPQLVTVNPGLLMHLFWQAARHQAHFHHETGQVVRNNLQIFSEKWRNDPVIVQEFFDILLSPMAFPVLKVMLETGFLETFLPELSPLRYRVQHDAYHLYTVDEHLLRTVKELHVILAGEDHDALPSEFSHQWLDEVLPERRILFLAALIHDVGKGQGHGHAQRGARMAVEIGTRLGLGESDLFFVVFLVDQHLLLAETALKRDLAEEKPVEECALNIGDMQRLAALYLLTVADSKATGPQVYTIWRRALIIELGLKVKHLLEQDDWQGQDVSRRIMAVKNEIYSLLQSDPALAQVMSWVDKLSLRYLLTQSAEAVVKHYFLEQELREIAVVFRAKALSQDIWELTLITPDLLHLFDYLTGVLWANGVNIVSADIYTRAYGVAVDVLIVDQIPDPLHPKKVWDRVHKDLETVLGRQKSLDLYMTEKHPTRPFGRSPFVSGKDKVVINEQASDFYTVIEVYTWERPGVLHTISKALHCFDLSIQVAKITTPGAQVVDVFYVTDANGNKVQDPKKHVRIKEQILASLQTCSYATRHDNEPRLGLWDR
ncbi:MAG: [protein-PII] uridylyltransferase [Desulfovermiculus sp.]|nr:[protein-PII] uridylyltransferase [Desulfovermiculus sp.]